MILKIQLNLEFTLLFNSFFLNASIFILLQNFYQIFTNNVNKQKNNVKYYVENLLF